MKLRCPTKGRFMLDERACHAQTSFLGYIASRVEIIGDPKRGSLSMLGH